jgi:hypothetical protein
MAGWIDEEKKQAQRILELLILLSIPCFAWGLWVCWPRIALEQGRLEPWKVATLWAGEAAAVLWLASFFARRYVLGEFWAGQTTTPAEANRFFRPVAVTFMLGVAIDLGMNAYVLCEDAAAFETAEVTQGEILEVTRQYAGKDNIVYQVTLRYADRRGDPYTTMLPVAEDTQDGFRPGVSAATARALRFQKAPVPVQVAYDPEWPLRCWLAEVGPQVKAWLEGGHLGLNAIVHLAQLLPLIFFFAALHVEAGKGRVPWWHPVLSVVPFLIEALFLGVLGPLFRWGRGG